MTEDAQDSSASHTTTREPIMSEKAISSEEFRKPLLKKKSVNKPEKGVKRKLNSLTDKNVVRTEQKKKKKPDKIKKQKQSKGESEDAAESVDSGCIADISGDVTDWPQVEAAVLEERNYVLSLLSWLPDFQWVVPDLKKPKPSSEGTSKDEKADAGSSKGTQANKRKAESAGTHAKLRNFLDEADEIDSLREKYTSLLKELRKGRKDKKKEGKLERKLKNLNKRNKKNTNRQRKLEQAEIYQKKHEKIEKKQKGILQKKKIFNEKGKLVFSKFDFSSGGNISTKAKNLENKVAQALKEREMRKKMEMEGDYKGAAAMKEVDAWSGALKRAEGGKVRDDLELLQKSLKKKEKTKRMSKKRWEERTAAVEKKMMDRQTKRKENLKARREAKVQNKHKKMVKKGHIVPGF